MCEAEKLRVTVKRIEVFSSFYVDFWRFSAKSAEVPCSFADVHKDGYTFNKYNNSVFKIVYWTIAFLKKNHRYAEK